MTIVLLVGLFGAIPKVESKSAFDYRAFFNTGGLYCLFNYPLQAHIGDTYDYELNVSAESSIQISLFEMDVIYFSANGENSQTYNIGDNELMNAGYNFSRDIEFTVPSTIEWYEIQVNFLIQLQGSSLVFLGYFTTNIVSKTYSELSSEVYSLQSNYTNLLNGYQNYNASHAYSNSEYNAMNSTYTQYVQSHSHTNTDYSSIQSQLNDATNSNSNLLSLAIILFVLLVASIGSTIFFATRRHKAKSP